MRRRTHPKRIHHTVSITYSMLFISITFRMSNVECWLSNTIFTWAYVYCIFCAKTIIMWKWSMLSIIWLFSVRTSHLIAKARVCSRWVVRSKNKLNKFVVGIRPVCRRMWTADYYYYRECLLNEYWNHLIFIILLLNIY